MPKKPSAPVKSRSRSTPTMQRVTTMTAPQNGRRITSKATTPNGSHSVTLPIWLAIPLKSFVSACEWAGRNRKPLGITALIVGLLYAPWAWHHATTYKLAAVCNDIGYSQAVVDRWGCGSDCTDREMGLTASFTLATAYSATHCDQLAGPPAPHDLVALAWAWATEATTPPAELFLETQMAEAE